MSNAKQDQLALRSFFIFNTLRPRQNGRHFADDTFKRIFLNENITISIKISLKYVPKGPINNDSALVQIVAWPAPSHYLNQWWLVYWRMYASLGLNELRAQLTFNINKEMHWQLDCLLHNFFRLATKKNQSFALLAFLGDFIRDW